jgi:hypothetical protein
MYLAISVVRHEFQINTRNSSNSHKGNQMKFLPLFLLLTALLGNAQTSMYSKAYAGNEVIQAGTPPFNSGTPAGTVVRNAAPYNTRIARVTDANVGGGLCNANNQYGATPSGGSYDIITNVYGTLLTITCSGGAKFIVGFNPKTLKMYPAPPATFVSGTSCKGSIGYSRLEPYVAYCRQGTALYVLNFARAMTTNPCGLGIGYCPDLSVSPTWTKQFDFSRCPESQSANPVWSSLLGIGNNDSSFTLAFSWTGYQGTARLTFNYVPGHGCETFDSQGTGVHPIRYDTAGVAHIIPINATWFVHDTTTNGPWVEIAATNCLGVDCGTSNGPPTWQAGTDNVVMLGAVPRTWGHHDYSQNFFINGNNPQIYQRLLTSPENYTLIGDIPCLPICVDFHMNAEVSNDTSLVLGTTWTPAASAWAGPYRNEVFGVTVDGSGNMLRFSPTWSSGTTATSFYAQEAIGAPSQKRNIYFFTSDMLGLLGKTTSGLNRWDVFAVDLTGN